MADIAFEKDLSVAETGIEGLKVVDLAVHGDSRGWFKENWQRAKMTALGIPDLRVVQNNISYNDSRGVTRGIHAEPWDKFISVARGSVFGAWVDLREGSETFGKVYTVSVNIIFTISTNAFSPIAPTRIRRIRQRGCAAFGA